MSAEHGIEPVHMLWGISADFPRPQLIAAWADGFVDAWADVFYEKRDEAIEEFLSFGDDWAEPERWTFWMTVQPTERPATPPHESEIVASERTETRDA